MSWVLLVLSLIFGVFSLLQFNHSESLLLWKLSIMSTEFGHWAALGAILTAIIAGFFKRKPARVALIISALSALLLFRPAIELSWNFHQWSEKLISSFAISGTDAKVLPNLSGLYSGAYSVPARNLQTIEFWKNEKDSLLLDFYPPQSQIAKNPWLLVVHGGGWDSGDRTQLADLNSYLAGLGIGVISIDYRLAPAAVWPAQKEDVWNAVHYVRAHANEMKLDPDKWAILGRSAGGQIAERIAFGPPDPGAKAPRGCIALYAPADLIFAYDLGREDDILKSRVLIRNYLGGSPKERPEIYRDASPLFWISKDSSPALIIHGPNDPLVWYVHSKNVYEKLRASNVEADLISIPWATHGFDYNISGPGSLVSTYATELFLRKVLK